MRKSYDNEIIYRKKNHIFGINFGADMAAEHEWGIDRLRKLFGMSDDAVGLEKKIITKVPEGLEWVEVNNSSGFWVKPYHDAKISNFRFDINSPLYTAWDEKSFVVLSKDISIVNSLRKVYEAITNLNAAIFVGGGSVFQNGGLKICIASEIPKEMSDAWLAADEKRIALKRAFDETGIEEKLRLAGKRYFSLRPDWDRNGKLIFWLNPCEQDKYNAMWATLKDLENWIQDKGPIVKSPATKRLYYND